MEITKDDFLDYEEVRQSGVTNMWNVNLVCELSGLEDKQVMFIMKNYSKLKNQFVKEESSEGDKNK